jgi:hypothetical protein
MALATYKDLCIDASDARRLGTFWAAALGRRLEEAGPTEVVLRGTAPAQTVWIDQVPEPKTVKNRVHWDVTGSSAALVDAGARLLRPATEDPEPDRRWDVLADPEGNEFCVFPL